MSEVPKRGVEWNPAYEAMGITQDTVDFYNKFLQQHDINNFLELFDWEEPWTAEALMEEFLGAVRRLEDRTNTSFGLERIDFVFMTPQEINHKSKEEKRQLQRRYGNYIIDNIAGQCFEVDEGYRIEIGMLGREKEVRKSSVAAHLGHELGHTIGGVFLEDPVHEELKAYLFSSLVLAEMHMFDVSLETDSDQVHVAARILRERLSDAGVDEAAAIATLIGEPFLGHNPRDIYLDRGTVRVY